MLQHKKEHFHAYGFRESEDIRLAVQDLIALRKEVEGHIKSLGAPA